MNAPRMHAGVAVGAWALVAVLAVALVWMIIGDRTPVRSALSSAASTQPPVAPAAPSSVNAIGNVTVDAAARTEPDRIVVTAKLDTHTVDLDTFDLNRNTALRGRDASVPPLSVDRTGTAHHQQATLIFPFITAPSALVIRDLDGVAETVVPLARGE